MARPTRSQTLYQQMLGRGLRPSPDKENCLVLDFVDIFRDKSLCSVPTLLGLDCDVILKDQSLCDMVEQQPKISSNTMSSISVQSPGIKSITVSHFNSIHDLNQNIDPENVPMKSYSKLEWVYIKHGTYALTTSLGSFRVEQSNDGLFQASLRRRLPPRLPGSNFLFARAQRLLIQAESLERIIKGVETFIKKVYPQAYSMAQRKAFWRTSPITDSQIKILSRFLPKPGNNSETEEETVQQLSCLSKGQASNMIVLIREGSVKNYQLLLKKVNALKKHDDLNSNKNITVGPLY